MKSRLSSSLVVVLMVLFLPIVNCIADSNITLNVPQDRNNSKIDKKVFGTCILGWESDHGRGLQKNVKLGADYGYGLWDAKWNEYAKEPLVLAKDIKVGSIRLIGQFTGWEKGVSIFGKKEYSFGLNEQLKFCQDIGAEPIICLQNLDLEGSYVKLFQYLKKRYPYVKYVEIGNESYNIFSAEDYAERYLLYYEMIKNINPGIKIGFVGHNVIWEGKVLAIIGNRFDFIVEHYYPQGGRNNDPRQDGNKVFADLFPKATAIEKNIQNTLNIMDSKIGERKPIAITEYNAWFVQEKPVPYRHCLGAALVNAELIRIFMKPENNILAADCWNFINEYWGMIANGFNGEYRTLNSPYYKRPNYLLFEMYALHFGEYLISSGNFFVPESDKRNEINGQWIVRKADGVDVKSEGDNVSIDFKSPREPNYYHTHKEAEVVGGGYYRVSGYLKAEGLNDPSGVCLEIQDGRGWNIIKSTATTEKISGTTGWIYVEAYYKTLPDAKSIKVIIRRIGDEGLPNGKVFVKGVVIERVNSENGIKYDDLSVNASMNGAGDKAYLMVINKNMLRAITSNINLKDFIPASEGNAWILNGPSVDATNEVKHDNVKITHKKFEVKGNPFEFTFEPHSLTAIELTKKQ